MTDDEIGETTNQEFDRLHAEAATRELRKWAIQESLKVTAIHHAEQVVEGAVRFLEFLETGK